MSIKNISPLSPLQTGILAHYQRDPNAKNYNDIAIYKVSGCANPEKLKAAIEKVLSSVEVFNTLFHWNTKQPIQLVKTDIMHNVDIVESEEKNTDKLIQQLIEQEKEHSFDIRIAPLIKIQLITISGAEALLVINSHHIILDGWSMQLFVDHCLATYQNKCTTIVNFTAFIHWLSTREDKSGSIDYWRHTFEDITVPCLLPETQQQGSADDYARTTHRLDKSRRREYVGFCTTNGITINTLINSAWALLLTRYTNDENIIFGLTHSGRSICMPDADKVIGPMIATISCLIALKKKKLYVHYSNAPKIVLLSKLLIQQHYV